VSDPVEEVVPAEGWGVLHLFFDVVGPREEPVDVGAAERLVEAFCAEEPYQALWSATLGQRADLGLVLIGPDLARLARFHRDLLATELGDRLVEVSDLGLVSLTELSEYTPREGDERHMAMLDARLHPRLPARRLIAFYPMSKRRDGDDNWYLLPFERRRELMLAHGAVGRRYHGRILQLITGATGLSDWEWGVTLLADDPKDIKDIVYEMRFDEASARYGEFGPFTVGLLAPLRAALELAGLAAS
jgi:peroxiredoxin